MSKEKERDFRYDHQLLDKVIHARIRFAALAYLHAVDQASFVEIRDQIMATDGNLSVHMRKLESAGYISCDKEFQARKPQTNYSITPLGRQALMTYRGHLDSFLGDEVQLQPV
ncbi:MAG: transcriptional regulator [Chlorobium sp.]|jgi:DNA-binding MarR family transcriptional regulator|uniref:winged helix-turn-helix domain-containing protein n=1 Tax=Chlorobium sp. TaxID=1095 RepID=UPI0025BCB25E|nr:transcriptional regulator [Chlorobium sp.]MCF8216236.1 transcriptional regulator [Chlorobium sp.]MCF8271138.1 transcriptional regulator [Chlorobium sp.]MCF8287512.1 transcriptional regulator [Chlorobium sp.]MCF8291051.1 transcriptional regulator [Chlorobium sp.]MCF8385146.1 transcriptional regulator [Chlorobium sp.]